MIVLYGKTQLPQSLHTRHSGHPYDIVAMTKDYCSHTCNSKIHESRLGPEGYSTSFPTPFICEGIGGPTFIPLLLTDHTHDRSLGFLRIPHHLVDPLTCKDCPGKPLDSRPMFGKLAGTLIHLLPVQWNAPWQI